MTDNRRKAAAPGTVAPAHPFRNGEHAVRSSIGPYAIVPAWVLAEVDPTALAVYVALALKADRGNHECWPSVNTLAAELGMSYTTVYRALGRLRDAGAVDWSQRITEHGGQTSNLYVVHVHQRGEGDAPAIDPPARTRQTPLGRQRPTKNQNQVEPEPLNQRAATVVSETHDEPPVAVAAAPAPKPRKRDDLFDAVMEACGLDYADVPKTAMSGYAKRVHELRDVGATPEEVHLRARVYRKLYPGAALTPHALAMQWAKCKPKTPGGGNALAENAARLARLAGIDTARATTPNRERLAELAQRSTTEER